MSIIVSRYECYFIGCQRRTSKPLLAPRYTEKLGQRFLQPAFIVIHENGHVLHLSRKLGDKLPQSMVMVWSRLGLE